MKYFNEAIKIKPDEGGMLKAKIIIKLLCHLKKSSKDLFSVHCSSKGWVISKLMQSNTTAVFALISFNLGVKVKPVFEPALKRNIIEHHSVMNLV